MPKPNVQLKLFSWCKYGFHQDCAAVYVYFIDMTPTQLRCTCPHHPCQIEGSTDA